MVDLMLLAPEITLLVTGLAIVLLGLFLSGQSKKILGYIATLGCLIALMFTLNSFGTTAVMFSNSLSIDALSQFFKLVFLTVATLVSIAAIKYTDGNDHTDEFYALSLFATIGMMMVASANDLMVLFVAFELASLATYGLAGFEKKNPASSEAAMKYFIIGSLSAALLLLGIGYVYGTTGTTNIEAIAQNIGLLSSSPMGILSLVLLIAGFGFKIALVPFHMWAPDTYQGSPSVVSALLAAGSKKMGFVAAFKVFITALIALQADWQMAFAILAVVTMTYGNIVALSQTSVKRMLAYSSLAQAGYITMALVVMTPMALTGGILYALSHGFMKAGAFIATAAVVYMATSENKDILKADHLDSFKGLGKRMPITALSLTVFVLALSGIPPTAGFMSKFVLFSSTIESGLVWLAVIAILNSALSLYYYARVVRYMYAMPAEGERVSEPIPYVVALLVAVAGVLAIGLWPEPFVNMAMEAAKVLIPGGI
ncbi:F(420)H(2) dehydrogenase subunit N [Methanococcoides sp. FTZ1]|uniref:F(420)H(2) dehydrogenase subunit N n=1 Tax=Methanococcoides sp. FTZ1 TaxID=3439061 RepID=UPI003F8261F5